MSIQAEINRINANIVNAYNAIEAKGGTIPLQTNSANLASAIESISGGGGDINITNGQIQNLQTISGTIQANTFISVKTLPPDISPGGTATLANVCRCASGGSDVKIFHIKNNKYVIFNCGAPRGDLQNNAVSASILTLGENGSISNLQFTELLPPSSSYVRSASWIYQLDELTFANFSQIGVDDPRATTSHIYYDIYKINSGLTEITMIKHDEQISSSSGSVYSRSRGGFYLNGENTSWILYHFSRNDLYLEAIKLSYNFSTNGFSKVKSKVFNDSSFPIKVSSYIYGRGLPHQVVALSPTNIYVILQRSEDINPNQFSIIDISYNGTKFIASRKGAISLGNTISSESRGGALFYYAVLGNVPYIIGAMAISGTTQEIGAYNINTGSYTRLKTNEKYITDSQARQIGYQTFIKTFDNQVLFIHPNQSSISSSTPYGLVGTLITRDSDGTLTYGSTKTIIQTRYNSLAENIITPTFLIENGIGKSLFYGFNDDLKYQYVPLDLASVNKIAPLTQSGVCNGLTKTICSATTAGQVWIPIIS